MPSLPSLAAPPRPPPSPLDAKQRRLLAVGLEAQRKAVSIYGEMATKHRGRHRNLTFTILETCQQIVILSIFQFPIWQFFALDQALLVDPPQELCHERNRLWSDKFAFVCLAACPTKILEVLLVGWPLAYPTGRLSSCQLSFRLQDVFVNCFNQFRQF